MYEVFDANMRKLDVLHLARDRQEETVLNGVSTIRFTLPYNDPKNKHCTPFAFIHDGKGQYYRILNDSVQVSDTGDRTYTAEHAIATLVDNVMFGITVIGGTDYTTSDVIRYILDRQTVQRWVLGQCDIEKQFEYGFESENLFNALMSVPNLFVERYKFTYDMNTYPWRVNLIRLDENARPDFYIRNGKNLLSENADATFGDLCTRLYLLGKGEGDNQTTIATVNNGLPYLDAPADVVAKYGIIEKIVVDRTIETPEMLLERGLAIFPAFQEPRYVRQFKVADLYEITGVEYDNAKVGDLTLAADDGYKAWITLIRRNLDVAGDMEIEMASTTMDLAAQLADWADRQRINEVYSQGATQVYQNAIQANADSNTPCVLNFYIPQQMIIVNRVLARITLESFRTDARITRGGGGGTSTSQSGGGGSTTSASSGNSTNTSTANGAATLTSENSPAKTTTTLHQAGQNYVTSGRSTASVDTAYIGAFTVSGTTGTISSHYHSAPNHRHDFSSSGYTGNTSPGTSTAPSHSHTITTGASGTGLAGGHNHIVESHSHSFSSSGYTGYTSGTTSSDGSHSHSFSWSSGNNVGLHSHSDSHTHGFSHYHDVSLAAHTHTVTVGNHTHSVSVPSHTHSVDMPSHSHSVTIPDHTHQMEFGIYRTGNPQSAVLLVNNNEVGSMEREREIDITDMLLSNDGKIPRESWIRFGVRPNDLAYVSITVFIQGFIQSRGGGRY